MKREDAELKKGKFFSVAVAVMLMASVFTGCGEKKSNQVRVAYFPNITHTQALVMKNKGMLEEKLGSDYEVKWTSFNAGPAEIEALFAGEIDLGYIGPVPAINAYDKSGGDLSIIAGATNGGAVLVTRKGLILNDIKELDGLKVAIPQLGNTQHLSLLNLLSENGLKTKAEGGTVEVLAVENSDVKTLMDGGQLDAALVPEPWGSILEHDIEANLFLDYKDIWMDGEYSTAVVIAGKDFMDRNPEAVKMFLEAHKEATLFINDNFEEAKSIVNREIEKTTSKPFDKEILDSAFSRLKISADIPELSIREFAKLNLQEKFINELPDDKLMDGSFLGQIK